MFPLLQEEFKADLHIAFLPTGSAPDGNAAGLSALVARENYFYRLFEAFFRENRLSHPPDLVFVPYLDYCLNVLSLRGSPFGTTPWGGIAMRPSFHLRVMGVSAPRTWLSRVKQLLFFRLLRNPALTVLGAIDPLLAQFVLMKRADLSERCRFLPDPADMQGTVSKQEARSVMGIADRAVVILAYGVMSLRKEVDVLLRSMNEPGFPEHGHVILAGRQDNETEALLALPGAEALMRARRLHVINAFLTGDDEYRLFAAADLLWMGYRRHYVMSGVMVRAGQMGLPMVGCEDGTIGWQIKNRQLGITLSLDDPRAVAAAIGGFVDNPEKMRACGQNGRLAFADHTPDTFIRLLFERIDEAAMFTGFFPGS
jgi:glycosyltransferase involved in cell wall biosynthesis